MNESSHDNRSEETPSEGVPAPEGPANLIDTDYVIGQDNLATDRLGFSIDLHGKVFAISALVTVFFVVLTLALQTEVEPLFNAVRNWLTSHLAWFFLLAGNLFVLLCLGLIVSPLGKVRIGGMHATPDFSYSGWFAMLFAAGMGIGLMFYGVSEPMSHFNAALGGTSVEDGVRTDWAPLGAAAGDTAAAAGLGMAATIFHWGLHPWAIYAVVALALAIFSFNKGLPLTMRSIFYPLLGERVWGWPGHVIDILAVFATLFGLATSLGLGASQATAGLSQLFGIPATNATMVLLILGITAVAILSIVAGVDKGSAASLKSIWGSPCCCCCSSCWSARRWRSCRASSRTWAATCATCRPCRIPSAAKTPTSPKAGPLSTGPGGFPGRPSSACSSRGSAAGARCASS